MSIVANQIQDSIRHEEIATEWRAPSPLFQSLSPISPQFPQSQASSNLSAAVDTKDLLLFFGAQSPKKRAPKKFKTPEEKDEAYMIKRQKNNETARRSRLKKKEKLKEYIDTLQERIMYLDSANKKLRSTITVLTMIRKQMKIKVRKTLNT